MTPLGSGHGEVVAPPGSTSLSPAPTTPAEADKYLTLYNKLVELKVVQENRLNELMAQVEQLATRL